ncbi:hypothetical protein SERLA73DRAFT_182054 [Serpula lacrymans var. lacrymans S7.3]|uniref:Protein ARV n=2 Tax=Serpula lacrymans var. lacrymans TaxID=341189 RepID=F8PZ67_SERL3|nr:uncharacterized protein SERLADRAFT_468519 [Serpula lacrymans var. lacrymans S7.9]EGN99180.1 hypothetical protein SERLA73DRAFT_182054 [Serpula lacrymans var. lacrymans S7.3]EGO24747.1 hypothetical protein SERLADRAFT_468519 [Serpula lacrymans var. lacrymans S7.9]
MPICTNCTHPISHLYTVYQSKYNLRLEQCNKCQSFADPYVEFDHLPLILDLILLKREVYRHLLYNRGTEPRRAYEGKSSSRSGDTTPETSNTRDAQLKHQGDLEKEHQREKLRWQLILRLGGGLILVDAFIRWAHLDPAISSDVSRWTNDTSIAFLRIFVGCLIETIAFHGGVMLASFFVVTFLDRIRSRTQTSGAISGIRQEFRLSLIPLTIFYSSLTKLFLLFLLSIWRPSGATFDQTSAQNMPYRTHFDNPFISGALEIWDEDKLDREWVVRNVLGGMTAGFGLRVVLDCHPMFTTVVILAGWAVKTAVADLVKDWVGGDRNFGEVWLEYSIP